MSRLYLYSYSLKCSNGGLPFTSKGWVRRDMIECSSDLRTLVTEIVMAVLRATDTAHSFRPYVGEAAGCGSVLRSGGSDRP